MDIGYIIMGLSVLVQAVIGYETGDLVMHSLDYSSSRGHVLTDAFVILICIVVRFLLDRWLVVGRDREAGGYSQIVLDLVAFVMGTILSLISLEMYATETVPQSVAVLILVVVLTVLYEKDIYMVDTAASSEEKDPYSENEENTEKKEILSKSVSYTEDSLDDDIELEIVSWKDEETKEEVKEENKETKEEIKEEQKLESKKEEDDPDNAKIVESSSKLIIAEVIRLFANVASVLFGVLILGDVVAEKFSPIYYLIVVLVAVLAVILKAMTRWQDSLIKNPNDKVKFVGFSATVVLFTILLCTRSILVGLVFLLGAYLVKLIVPMVMYYWGTGGTKVVRQKADVLSRFVTRFFVLVILLLDVWLLSYGAIWEIDFMLILAVAIGSSELLLKQNRTSNIEMREGNDIPLDIDLLDDLEDMDD